MPMGTVSRPAADSQTAHLAQRRLKRRLSPLALRPVVVSGGSGKRLLPVQIPGLCWRFWLGSQEMNLLQQPRYSHLRNNDLVYPTAYGWFPKHLERVSNFRNTHRPQLPPVLSSERPSVAPRTSQLAASSKTLLSLQMPLTWAHSHGFPWT